MEEVIEKRPIGERIKEGLANHVVNTTAILTSTNPVFSYIETEFAGLSDGVSIDSRLMFAKLSYLGMGFLYAGGRKLSRKILKVNERTSEKIQGAHDAIYTAGFNFMITPPVYLAMGADFEQAISGGIFAAAISIPLGPIMGYSMDAARDLIGMEDCERKSYPKLIKKRRPLVKKVIAGFLAGASIAAMAGIYHYNSSNGAGYSASNTELKIEREK